MIGQKPQSVAPSSSFRLGSHHPFYFLRDPILLLSPLPEHRGKKAAQNQHILHWRHSRSHLHQFRMPDTQPWSQLHLSCNPPFLAQHSPDAASGKEA